MISYFANRDLSIKGFAATGLPTGLCIYHDKRTDEIRTGTSSFEFSFHCPSDKWTQAEEMAAPGGICIRDEDGETKLYQIVETQTDSAAQAITCMCEDAGLQLLGSRAAACSPSSAQGAGWYIEQTLEGTSFGVGEIGVDGTKKIAFDQEATCVERLLSIAEEFDGELVYSYEVDQMGGSVAATVGLVEKRGRREPQTLYVGRQISRLEIRTSAAEAATDIVARGGIPSGKDKPVTLIGSGGWSWAGTTDYDEDGNAVDVITLDLETGTLHSAFALERWGATITRVFEGRSTTKDGLLEEALADLRQRRDVEREYDVELASLADGTQVGDDVTIVDDARGIYVTARLLTLSKSVTDGTWAATIGDALIRSSGISERLEKLAQKVGKQEEPYTIVLTSSAGWLTRTGGIQGTIYPTVWKGTDVLTNPSLRWKVDDSSVVVIDPVYLLEIQDKTRHSDMLIRAEYAVDGRVVATVERTISFVSEITKIETIYAQATIGYVPTKPADHTNFATTWSEEIPEQRDNSTTFTLLATWYSDWEYPVYTNMGRYLGYGGKKGADAVTLRIDSSRGNTFKNNTVSTELRVTIYYGSYRIETYAQLQQHFPGAYLQWEYCWIGEDVYRTISAGDSRFADHGFRFTISPEDVDTKIVFRCNMIEP